MNILITGGTGFIGRPLCHRLLAEGHQLLVFSRQVDALDKLGAPDGLQVIHSLAVLPADTVIDVIINLAGEPIADRLWTRQRKQVLWDSRIGVTGELLALIERLATRPELLISASAVGYYGDTGDRVLDESAHPASDDFAHRLCAAWENEAMKAEKTGVRVAILRIGLVLGEGGGFLQRMRLPFSLGLGSRLGNGKQWMAWIHRDDLLGIMLRLITDEQSGGIYNATAPEPVRNEEFTRSLAAVLARRACLVMPAAVLRMLAGEMSVLLLGGQRAVPQRLLDAGFRYQYRKLQGALRASLE